MYKLMILNPGSTSTKISFYEDEKLTAEKVIRHTDEEMASAPTQKEQVQLRKERITEALEKDGISLDGLDGAVIRVVGVTRCTKSGTYQIGNLLKEDLYKLYDPDGSFLHAGRMTYPLLDALLGERKIPIFLVDPIHVDEFSEIARISGHPLLPRTSTFHALNQKAVARQAAKALGKSYEEVKLVVAHMGGGVSVGAHDHGRVVDASNCGMGATGPFSPNRAGDVPPGALLELCFSGKYTRKEIENMLLKNGGFKAYLGVSDAREAQAMADKGDKTAQLVLKAFSYQVAKEIAAQCAVLSFMEVDGIVLTGGLAYSQPIVEDIKNRLNGIAPVFVYPGEKEAEAMIAGALRVLRGEAEAMVL